MATLPGKITLKKSPSPGGRSVAKKSPTKPILDSELPVSIESPNNETIKTGEFGNVTFGSQSSKSPEIPVAIEMPLSEIESLPFLGRTHTPSSSVPQAIEVQRGSSEIDDLLPYAERDEPPGFFSRMGKRMMGTDVRKDEYQVPRTLATITGSILGSYIGSKTPMGPGATRFVINPLTGMVVSSAVGAWWATQSPEAIMEAAEFFDIVPEGFRKKHGLSPSELRYIANQEALLDLTGSAVFTGIKMAYRTISQTITGAGGRPAKELAQEALEKYDIWLAPVQIGVNKIPRGFVNVMGRFPFIGTSIKKVGGKAEEGLRNAYKLLGSRIGVLVSASDVSQLIFRDAQNLMKDFNKEFGGYYDKIYEKADLLGVNVLPKSLITKGEEILKDLDLKAQVSKSGPRKGEKIDGEVLSKVREFIEENVMSLKAESSGAKGYGFAEPLQPTMTLRQIDGLIERADQLLSTLEKGQKKFAMSLLKDLRTSAQHDMLKNTVGREAAQISASLRKVDELFSSTMTQLFESTTAKRMQIVRRKGIKGVVKSSEELTQTSIDQLSQIMLKLENPTSIDELWRLVTPDTFKQIVARSIEDSVQNSKKIMPEITPGFKAPQEGFSSQKFAQELGLDTGVISSRKQSLEKMLRLSGSKITLPDLESLLSITRAIESLPLPNVSTFLQRKGVIGGLKGVIRGVLPGVAMAGTGMASLWGLLLMIGGGKLVSKIITDPKASHALSKVLRAETEDIVANKFAYAQLMRYGITALFGEGSIGQTAKDNMMELGIWGLDAIVEERISAK